MLDLAQFFLDATPIKSKAIFRLPGKCVKCYTIGGPFSVANTNFYIICYAFFILYLLTEKYVHNYTFIIIQFYKILYM